jgi:copper chaperone
MIEDLKLTAGPAADATPDTAGSGCGCGGSGCGDSAAAAPESGERATAAGGVTTTYGVAGMTCGHCVAAVTEELSALDGVTSVDVELAAGGTSVVHVVSTSDLDRSAVAHAVDEAGYELVTS